VHQRLGQAGSAGVAQPGDARLPLLEDDDLGIGPGRQACQAVGFPVGQAVGADDGAALCLGFVVGVAVVAGC